MHILLNLILFIITLAGGSLPLWTKGLDDKKMHLLLAFSGSFLLSITFLHLLPETFTEIGSRAGLLLLVGFFVQLLIQRFTHGLEHGHVHVHHGHRIPLTSIFMGLALHAFMEGLPLGFNYKTAATEPSLYMAVAVHKLPEAMLVATLFSTTKGRSSALTMLLFFSLLTPGASILAAQLGENYGNSAEMVLYFIPIVAGAFIHIATTIFFESGTKQHMLTWQKITAILSGVGIALVTLLLE
jgi:zinc and cadmium transporter